MAEKQTKIDLRSAFAYFLVRWKTILLLTLVCAVLATAFGYYRKSKKTVSKPVSYEQELETARSKLTEEDAAFTEQVYSQYETYFKRLGDWNSYIGSSVLQSLSPYDYRRIDMQYSVESDNGDAISAFSASLLGSADYDKIAAAIGAEAEAASYLNELVYVTSAASSDSAISPSLDGSKDGKIEVFNTTGDKFTGIMNIAVLGADEESVRAMEKIVDQAVAAKADSMTKGGTATTALKISSILTANDAKTLMNLQQTAILPLISTQTNRSNFVKNTVDTMSEAQKTYFEILCQEHEEEAEAKAVTKVRKINLKKYVAAGAAGGFLLAILLLYIRFAFAGVIRTGKELSDNYGLSVLHRFRVGSGGALGKADVIRSHGLAVLGGDEQQAGSAASLAAELAAMMKKAEISRLYIACDCDRKNVRKLAEDLQRELVEASPEQGAHVDLGNPMGSEADYRTLLTDEAVVVVETLGFSRRETLSKLIEICSRNGIKILGGATVLEDGNV